MTKSEKKQFITTVCDDLKRDLLSRVDKTPEEWDGVQLRLWIADYYKANYTGFASVTMKDRRARRSYENDILTLNLT